MDIRPGTLDDLPAIVAVYNCHVLGGYATFHEVALTVAERVDWLETFSATGPYRIVVAEDSDDSVVGFACSNPYGPDPWFSQTVECSVYLAPERRGQGLGTRLYTRLLGDLETEDLHRAVAGIALPNEASVRLHRRVGFTEVGVFDEYAVKWGQYVSSLWMQRPL